MMAPNHRTFGFYRGLFAFLISIGLLASILVITGRGQEGALSVRSANAPCRRAEVQRLTSLPGMAKSISAQDFRDSSFRPRLLLASYGMRHDYGIREHGERVAPAFSRMVQTARYFPVLVLVGLVGIILLAYRLWWYKPLIPVMVVARREIQGVVKGLGTVRFQESVTVRSEISGTIEKLHVTQGDKVTKGQILAELTSSTLKNGAKAAPEDLVPLVAPTDGVITNRVLVVGDEVYPGTPIFQIVEAQQIRIALWTNPIRGAQVRAGQAAAIKLGSDREFAGQVMEIRKDPEPTIPQAEILVKFQDAPDPAVIGEEAVVIISTGCQTAPAVPISAVIFRNDQIGVFVIDDAMVNFRLISLGVQNGKWAAALEGVKDGELIIVAPETVKQGKEVRAEVVTAAFMEE
jgi:multidrug efflux pump subunit AcrA (membrane-fusion protein)